MSLEKVTMYTVVCDNCGKNLFDGSAEVAGCSNVDFTQDIALESGWHKEGKKHYCPDCWTIGEYDEVVIKEVKK